MTDDFLQDMEKSVKEFVKGTPFEKYAIQQLANTLHDCGFNVFPVIIDGDKKRPYIPLGADDPFLWQYIKKKRLNKEQLLEAINITHQQVKQFFLGIIPGKINEGKYQGKFFWAIDFDDPNNIELLGITPEKCKENGVWFEKSLRKGYHLYGMTLDTSTYDKQHKLGIELFSDDTFFIAVYGNFEHELYDLQPMAINEVYNGWKQKLAEEKGIKLETRKTPIKEIKKGVRRGSRDDSAFKLAINYRRRGLTIEETTGLIFTWNKKNKPPLHDQEIIKCIKSAYSRGLKPQEKTLVIATIERPNLFVEILDPAQAWKEIKCYEMTPEFVLQPIYVPLRCTRDVTDKRTGEIETKKCETMGIVLLCIDKDGKRELIYPASGRYSDSTFFIQGKRYKIPSEPYNLKTLPSPGVLKRFIDSEPVDGKELWKQCKQYRMINLDVGEDKRKYIIQTAWDLGTHFHMVYNAYSYQDFFGFRGSGKNRAHEISYELCFHALMIASSRSISSIFRGIDAMGCTWLKNEAETLIGENKDKDLYELCLEGYKRGGQVSLTSDIGKDKNRSPLYFDIYSPKSFASDKSIYGAFGTRMIKYLQEKTTGDQGKKELDKKIASQLRDDLYLLRLQDGCRIATLTTKPCDEYCKELLQGYDLELVSRDREIFYPLLIITKEYGSPQEYKDLICFIKDYLEQQKQESIDQPIAIVLRAVYSLCLDEQKKIPQKEEFWVSLQDVRGKICYDDPEAWRLTKSGGYENKEIIKTSETAKFYTERRIGSILDSLGFETKKRGTHGGIFQRKIDVNKVLQKSKILNISIEDVVNKEVLF